MKRPGYYVEGEWFGDRFHQARARAAFLAAQYSRPIDLKRIEHESETFQLVLTVINGSTATGRIPRDPPMQELRK